MLKNFKKKILKKIEIITLAMLIIFTAIFTTYFNNKNNNANQAYESFINNVYLKKTLNEIINNLEPKYKKINHKIQSGETFDKILREYSIDEEEILIIKKNPL
jgi:cell division protein FtsX